VASAISRAIIPPTAFCLSEYEHVSHTALHGTKQAPMFVTVNQAICFGKSFTGSNLSNQAIFEEAFR
jgi:hypothetical protein